MRSKWQLVRDLFERALEEQPADLTAWLAEATDDPDVRAEVRSLLDQHTEAGEFLSEPVQDRLPSLVDDDEDKGEAFPAGSVFGRYTIVRELDRGGMGRVYLATDGELPRNVALKAIDPRFANDPRHKERLRREAQTAAGLAHPGICTVHDFVEYDGNVFIVTEYVDGRTLRKELAAGSGLTSAEVLRTARDIADALAYAHTRGVVHRDLKPENVMRTGDGRVKILDFGIARVDRPDGDPLAILETQPGVLVGTIAYMAPERLNGERGDARSDVFSFGVMLYELASGVHPFKGESAADVISRILKSDATPIEDRCPGLPVSVCCVIERCLNKSPTQRFRSASEITGALSVEPTPPRPTPDPDPDPDPGPVRWWRAHQAIIVGLYFLAAVFAWFIKQGVGTPALVVFGIVGVAATVGGILRFHLLFVERVNHRRLTAELRRTERFTWVTDAVIAVALIVDAVLLPAATNQNLAAVLIASLGAGIFVARAILETSTTADAFGR
jgi:predicted Ser/Thr protein kinase